MPDQERKRPEARFVRPGEMLAIKPEALHSGPQGFFWLFGGGIKSNERRGDVSIVYVRGALDHHSDSWGENYESIVVRVRDAMTGDDVMAQHKMAQNEHEWRHKYDDDYAPLPDVDASKPAVVLLEIDSPGGVVSGLNETVAKLRAMAKEYGVRLVAYCNEMAASAAYALACACSEIVCPRSAIVGSIGVISTMASQAAADKKAGLDYRLITSGARKADGHPHAPISDAAEEAERGRVEKLAIDFWRLAAKARGLTMAKVRSFEAGIYLGKDAKRNGLVDDVLPLDEAIGALSRGTPNPSGEAGGNETDRRAKNPLDSPRLNRSRSVTTSGTLRPERTMPVGLDALIKRTQAAIAAETNPKRRAALAADLSRQMTVAAECDDGDEDDEEDEKKSKKAAKRAEEEAAAAAPPVAAKPPYTTKKAEEEEEEEEESAKSALALLERTTGAKGSAAIGAAAGIFARLERVEETAETLRAEARATEKSGLIAKAVKYVPSSQIDWLKTQSLSVVRGFVEQATKGAPMVMTEEGELLVPKVSTPGTKESLPKEMREQIAIAVAACPRGVDPKKYEADLVANMVTAFATNPTLNGAAGRY